jgi:hypothetical protein
MPRFPTITTESYKNIDSPMLVERELKNWVWQWLKLSPPKSYLKTILFIKGRVLALIGLIYNNSHLRLHIIFLMFHFFMQYNLNIK